MKKMKISFHGKKFWVDIKETNFFTKTSGLMFRTRETDNLLFDFRKRGFPAIHSFFVFFDFLALWLDEKDKIVDYEIVRPFTLHVMPKKQCKKLVEIPLNKKNQKIFSYFYSN